MMRLFNLVLKSMSLSRILLIACVLIAFVGKSMSFVPENCDMESMTTPPSQMAHAHHQGMMSDMATDAKANKNTNIEATLFESDKVKSHANHSGMAMDCCDDCTCPDSMCSSASMLNNTQAQQALIMNGSKVLLPTISFQSLTLSNLYRPPILT